MARAPSEKVMEAEKLFREGMAMVETWGFRWKRPKLEEQAWVGKEIPEKQMQRCRKEQQKKCNVAEAEKGWPGR